MVSRYAGLVKKYKTLLASISAGFTWQVLRPNFNQVDGTPVSKGIHKFNIEPCANQLAQDRIIEIEYYMICGNPDFIQPGDILVPVGDYTTITVLQDPDNLEFEGFRTTLSGGRITNIQQDVYNHIYYDFIVASNDGREEYRKDPESLNLAVRRVVMFTRPGVYEGMVFIEGSGTTWQISQVEYRGHIMELFLDGRSTG